MQAPALSLKRQLLLWLLLPQLLLWLVGATLTYRIALSYTEKGIDQSLTQSLRSLARQVKPIGSGLLIDFPRAAQAIMEEDPQDRVSYMVSNPPGQFVLGNAMLPNPPPAVMQTLAQSDDAQLYQAVVEMPDQPSRTLRIAAMELRFGDDNAPQRMRVQVAKSLTVRDRIARELVLDMLIPLLLLGLMLGGLVYVGIARGLQPLARLQAKLQAQSLVDAHLAAPFLPIALEQAPQEVHSLATAVNQLLAAVARSVSQEKRFVNDAAHQLRTPLAGLQAQLELVFTEPDPQALRERLKKIDLAVRRSGHLIHQLLQLARSESDAPMEMQDAIELARNIAQDAAPSAILAGADFGFEVEADENHPSLAIHGNALLLREAVSNMIDNALRYAGYGARITLRVRRLNQAVFLEVEDNGPGLTPALLESVFERFFRASENPDGVGLGLAIVREVAHRHGGYARAINTPARGLLVQLALPLASQ